MQKIIIIILLSFILSNNEYHKNLFFISDQINELDTLKLKNNTSDKIKAIIYSGLIPGSGQYFVNDQKIKGAFFLGFELIGWIAYNYYTNKAQDYKEQYQRYADDHWFFSEWCDHYYDFEDLNNPYRDLFSNEDSGEYSLINTGHGLWFSFDDDGIIKRMQTNTESFGIFYEDNNLADDGVAETFVSEHNLSVVKDHDFYEEIIKYDQFFTGWDDQDSLERITNDWGQDNATSPHKTIAKNLYDQSVRNYKIQDWVMSSIFANHAISMIDALIINAISSQRASFSYNYNPIINFHEAQLIIKLN